MRAQIHVEGLHGGEPEKFVTLLVRYGQTAARIELPIVHPKYELEPGIEVYRRQLHELLMALDEWEKSREPISWRDPHQT